MTTLEARIAEVLAGHQREESGDWFRGSWVVITSCSCEKDYGVTDDEEYRAHVAAMLAPVIREVKVEALREAAGAMGDSELINHWEDSDVTCDATASEATQDWLRTRADNLEKP